MDSSDKRRRANRGLIVGLLAMTVGSFAFGWALVPLYDVFCRVAGIGNAEAKAGRSDAHEAVDRRGGVRLLMRIHSDYDQLDPLHVADG